MLKSAVTQRDPRKIEEERRKACVGERVSSFNAFLYFPLIIILIQFLLTLPSEERETPYPQRKKEKKTKTIKRNDILSPQDLY